MSPVLMYAADAAAILVLILLFVCLFRLKPEN